MGNHDTFGVPAWRQILAWSIFWAIVAMGVMAMILMWLGI